MIGDQLLHVSSQYLKKSEYKKVQKAFEEAKRFHEGQTRKTGEPYIMHPVAVAFPLAKMRFDYETICAALLHDVIEDTPATKAHIKREFGDSIADLVDGVTKLKKIKFKNNLEEYSVENLRKMLIAMAKDIRVIIVKLSDRLHNLQTLEGLTDEQKKRIAEQTLAIYVPLASRLSIGSMRSNLEDIAFRYADPVSFQKVIYIIEEKIPQKESFLKAFTGDIQSILEEAKVKTTDIHGRVKGIYSLHKKLTQNENDIDRIYDLVALRVIVPDIHDCYKTLGLIHNNYKPLVGRIKDYIATPKANGYQSLHTTVITPQKEIVEVQIRTEKMHYEAEYGVAAHWFYKEKTFLSGDKLLQRHDWIKQLSEWQKKVTDSSEFTESLKLDFFEDRIFVFTPKGEVLDLPRGATPVDFAYQIHTDIGHRCIGAKVNNKMTSLDTQLHNGDRIEVVTGKNKKPSHDWLNFVKTNAAKSKIKTWFKKARKDHNIEDGRHILNRRLEYLTQRNIKSIKAKKKEHAAKILGYKDFESALIALGQGELSVHKIVDQLVDTKKESTFRIPEKIRPFVSSFFNNKKSSPKAIIEGERGILSNIARCCNPVPGDQIKAYITKNHASIHKETCKELTKRNGKSPRVVSAAWDTDETKTHSTQIEIHTLDRVGLIRDVSVILSDMKINIEDLKQKRRPKSDVVIVSARLQVRDLQHIMKAIDAIERIGGVLHVYRK